MAKVSSQRRKKLVAAQEPLVEVTNGPGVFSLEFDGASKGNPGKAGAGAILRSPDGSLLCELTKGVGIATCNFAEYQALIIGLQGALDQGICHIKAQGDSKLVCKQVMGQWKVRSENLATSFAEAMELKRRFRSFSIQHVCRESNSAADALANTASRLPEDKLLSYYNTTPDTRNTAKISKKSSRKHKVAEDQGAAKATPFQQEGLLNIVPDSTPKCMDTKHFSVPKEAKERFYRLEYHGACDGNRGKAGVGALLYSPDGLVHLEIRRGLGLATRNVAHYQALVIGLRAALDCSVSHINIQGDGFLVFKQMMGQIKVKDENLLALWKEANALLTRFTEFSIIHVGKVENSTACALAEASKYLPESHSNDKASGSFNKCGIPAAQGQGGSRKFNPNGIIRSMESLNTVSNSVSVMIHCSRAYPSYQLMLRPSYSQQVCRVPRIKAPQAMSLPFSRVMSKCCPLYAANTSIHGVAWLLPSAKLRHLPHIFQRSFMHIVGAVPRSAFTTFLFR